MDNAHLLEQVYILKYLILLFSSELSPLINLPNWYVTPTLVVTLSSATDACVALTTHANTKTLLSQGSCLFKIMFFLFPLNKLKVYVSEMSMLFYSPGPNDISFKNIVTYYLAVPKKIISNFWKIMSYFSESHMHKTISQQHYSTHLLTS